ncbi:MAG: Grx4 family monothiol glutaredoxin [Myxococcales bacterium]|nr:Grx4 family monothiol glutaredoxin [Myxococcales bacterium]
MGKKISLPIIGDEPTEPAPATGRTRADGGTVHEEIDYEVKHNAIVLYMKGTPDRPQCGFSQRATQILQVLGQPFYSVNILEDPEKRQAIKEYSDWPTIPQLYVGGEFIGGSDIMLKMYQSGELEELVKG